MRGRSPAAVVALAAAVLGLAAWRAACVLAGPDIDTDAYAHHMIARAILADPRDLAVHWVWLPLFHYLQVPLVALGGTMNDVRWANVALSAALPVLLFAYLRRTTRNANDTPGEGPGDPMPPTAVALLAAVLAAACPIAMQMGTTAQSEPLFAILALGIAVAFQDRRYGITAALLGAAVLLRYEGWAVLAAVAALTLVEPLWPADRASESGGSGSARDARTGRVARAAARWGVVAVPVALILGWAVLRRPVDGRWFGFLGDTHQFASQAMAEKAHRGVVGFVRDALYYPLFVAIRVMGPAVPLAAFGVWRTWRQQGPRFVLVLAAVLGFISLTWLNRSSLGLDRHFVAVVPLYATFAAQGVAAIAARVAQWSWSGEPRRPGARAGRIVASVLSLGMVAGLAIMLDVWMGFWKGSVERGWPEREAIGAYLRTVPPGTTVFCDDATLEILSRLDRRRFDRHWTDDPSTWDRIEAVAQSNGVAYVATWRRKLAGHERAGDVVFSASDAPDDPSAGAAVLRVRAGADRLAR
jgi:hypothetical protein